MSFDAPTTASSDDASTVDADVVREIATTKVLSFASPQELNALKELDIVNTLGDFKRSCDRDGILATDEPCWLCDESLDVENQQPLGNSESHCSPDEIQANGHATIDALHSSQLAQFTNRNTSSPKSQLSLLQRWPAFQPKSKSSSESLQSHTESRTEWYAHVECPFAHACIVKGDPSPRMILLTMICCPHHHPLVPLST
jgi:hypothetical protein